MIFPACDDARAARDSYFAPRAPEPKPTALYAAVVAESRTNAWASINGFAAARLYSSLLEEHAALAEGLGLVDLGPLCRYTVRGEEAAAFVGRATTAPCADIRVGESARGLMLDADGAVVDLCDVSRLASDLFLLTTSTTADRRLQAAARGLDALVENISGVVAALGLMGPKAAAVAAAAGFSVEADALASQGRVRGVESFIRPIVYGSASGHEIIYPADEALTLWERVRRAARGLRLSPAAIGLDALEVVRIAGGAPRPGVDFIGADRAGADQKRLPVEIGLPHLAPANRAWFNGRRALKGADGARRLVTLSADADTVAPGAPVAARGSTIGVVTSAAYAPRFRAAVCFADIDRAGVAKNLDMTIERGGAGGSAAGGGGVRAQFLETDESGLAAAFRQREKKSTERARRFV